MKLLISLLLLSGLIVGCAGDSADDGSSANPSDSMALTRVVAKEYIVLASREDEMHCRATPARDTSSVLSLKEGQKLSLVSLQESGVSNGGDFWLHVYVGGNSSNACYVLAEILAPIGSYPVIE